MSTATKPVVRKGKPDYVKKSEEEYPTEDSAPATRAADVHNDDGCYHTEDAPAPNAAAARGLNLPLAGANHTEPAAASQTIPQPATSAAAKASLQRHKDVATRIQSLLQLLLRSRDAEESGDAAQVPPTPEEIRPLLDDIRDYCVAANNKTKFEGGNASPSRAQAEPNDDDLNRFYALTFLSTLFFANESEDMLRESVETAVERLRAAEGHGREELYHNAVVEAVNNILLFTPLTAPPVWLLKGERTTTSASQGVASKKRRETKNGSATASHRASVSLDASAEAALEDVAAVVREMLYKMDHPDYTPAGEEPVADAAAAPTDAEATADAEPASTMILEDDCLDYLSSDGGAPALDEQHWFDVWLSVIVEGYVHLSATALAEASAAEDADAQGEGARAAAEGDGGVTYAVPALLPRPVWRSAANNAYAQFAAQLVAIFFTRSSDGSLNYCARVHKLVQYYQHRLRQSSTGCTPIPTKNAARPQAPPKAAPRALARGLDVEKAEKETQTTARNGKATPPPAAAAAAPVEEAERGPKSVMIFHPSVERSSVRASRELPAEPEPEVDEEEEELDPLRDGFSRFHKCYTADDTPDFTAKKRIPVDPEEYPTEDPAPAATASRAIPEPEEEEVDEEQPEPEKEEEVDEEQPEAPEEYPTEDPAPAAASRAIPEPEEEEVDEEQPEAPEEYPTEDPAPADQSRAAPEPEEEDVDEEQPEAEDSAAEY